MRGLADTAKVPGPPMDARSWIVDRIGVAPLADIYCPTRDVAQARVERLPVELAGLGWSEDARVLVTAVLGELVNNCFDHNLGKWRDIPGCWFEWRIEDGWFRATVADRGQGVLTTLRKVRPSLADDEEAVLAAFTEVLTGRAPEERGNGLKFVLLSLGDLGTVRQFTFRSGTAILSFQDGIDTKEVQAHIVKGEETISGTLAEVWVAKL